VLLLQWIVKGSAKQHTKRYFLNLRVSRQRLRDLEIEKLQGLRNDARHQWAELVPRPRFLDVSHIFNKFSDLTIVDLSTFFTGKLNLTDINLP